MKWYLGKIKGIDFTKCCMMTTAYEGDYDTFHMQRRESKRACLPQAWRREPRRRPGQFVQGSEI